MSTITKKRAQEIFLGNGPEPTASEERELARIALASLEAEAVAYIIQDAQARGLGRPGFLSFDASISDEDINEYEISVTPLYTAPQLPQPAVAVPLAIHDEDFEKALSVLNDTLDDCGDSERGLLLALDKAGIEVRSDAYRAAMLQAEPVSNSDELPLDYLQGHKDGLEWAAQLAEANHPQTGDWLYDDPIDLARAISKGPDMPTAQAGNHTEQHLDMVDHSGDANKMVAGNSPVIPDGWKLVPIDPTKDMLRAGQSVVGFWLNTVHCYSKMLAAAPAAPKQEVTQALAKGMERYGDAMQKLADSGD